jgi:hypothetical protein
LPLFSVYRRKYLEIVFFDFGYVSSERKQLEQQSFVLAHILILFLFSVSFSSSFYSYLLNLQIKFSYELEKPLQTELEKTTYSLYLHLSEELFGYEFADQ